MSLIRKQLNVQEKNLDREKFIRSIGTLFKGKEKVFQCHGRGLYKVSNTQSSIIRKSHGSKNRLMKIG